MPGRVSYTPSDVDRASSGGRGDQRGLTRREVLVAGGVGAGALALGGVVLSRGGGEPEADITLRAVRSEVELGSRRAATWTYDGRLPGREVRLEQGKPVRIRLVNELKQPTTIHWHGIRLANEADGVPDLTQDAIAPGEDFVYEFTPPDAGTYFFHPHVGTQLDRGLYAALIVDPRREDLEYDREGVLLIDDWLDGVDGNPDAKLAELRRSGMDMGGMDMDMDRGGGGKGSGGMDMGTGGMGGGAGARPHTTLAGRPPGMGSLARLANELEAGRLDPGDVRDYPLHLMNGRPPEDPARVSVRRGDRLRLRLVNPSADTLYCVFVEDHELEVVRADGVAVRPVRTDAVLLGMGERYDALVEARGSGVARIIAMPLGKRGRAVAMLRYAGASGRAPRPDAPFRAPRRVLSYEDLRAAEQAGAEVGRSKPRVVRLDLGLKKGRYVWTIGGQAFPKAERLRIGRDEEVRFVMRNRTMMPHPMHLHGHVFRVGGPGGALKDTALALPMRELTLDWVADNPGSWAFHCHNVYHQEAGMMRHVEVA